MKTLHMLSTISLVTICLWLFASQVVDAYPNGAAVCISGDAAPQGPHSGRGLGGLSMGNYEVSLEGDELALSGNTVNPTQSYSISVDGVDGATFRGFLIRASATDGTVLAGSFSSPGNGVQIMSSTGEAIGSFPNAGSCATNVAGACHTSSSTKTSVQVDWTVPASLAPGTVVDLEITVLARVNQYYYSRFQVSTAAASPTPSPTQQGFSIPQLPSNFSAQIEAFLAFLGQRLAGFEGGLFGSR